MRTPLLALLALAAALASGARGQAPAAAPAAHRPTRFREPDPMDFSDHAGFVRIFDGRTLAGWDGDPSVWHVEDGAIVGVSTREKPVRNSYLSYHGTTALDFDLKLEIKTVGPGGSGIQYRSQVGLPWTKPPVPGAPAPNLAWMMTGPQADFWPPRVYSGQFYSENTPLGIVAWRGQVVDSVRGRNPRLVGNIAGREELGAFVRNEDWNQYEIVARGGVMMHLLNGRLMAVEIDDDPASSSNQPGLIGLEIEGAPCRVLARGIWLRKLR
ncbi:MAG TPA: DUF1080 domain-containing protein [Opitutaceae bacterium]|nr:DUF1080 domain-containing protein [Opitutaceae bacterium]